MPSAPPAVALVVPVRDESASIDLLAASIAEQTLPPDAVVFVDGGSVDDTAARLDRWASSHPTWQVLRAGPATPGRGRNIGIEATTTPWIALADAGMVLDPHWLARLVEVAGADPTLGIVFGHLDVAADTFVQRCAGPAFVMPPRRTERGPMRHGWIACSLLRRDVWEQAGRFPDLRAAEDGIFLRRLDSLGVPIGLAPEARLVWSPPPTLVATFRRFRNYSRVNVLAGQQRYWHHGVARQYAVAASFAVAGLRWRPLLALPAVGFAARTIRAVALAREGRSATYALDPIRVAGVAALLLTCDLATYAGWLDATRERRAGRSVQG